MGAKPPPIVYSAEVPNQVQPSNQTKTRRNPQFINYLWSSPNESRNLRELFSQTFRNFAKRKCFGYVKRAETSETTKQGENLEPFIEYLTYQEVAEMVEYIARSILANHLVSQVSPTQTKNVKFKILGICSDNRVQWQITAIACNMCGIVVGPITEALSIKQKAETIRQTEIKTLFCSKQIATEIAQCDENLGHLRTLVCFNLPEVPILQKLDKKQIICLAYHDLLTEGRHLAPHNAPVVAPNSCAFIFSSSSTTGQPKGVMISHMNLISCVAIVRCSLQKPANLNDVYISYLPISHATQIVGFLIFMTVGARAVFSSIKTFAEDIHIIKPTYLTGPPHLFNMITQKIRNEVDKLTGCKRAIFNAAYNSKLHTYNNDEGYTHRFYDSVIFKKIRESLGGKLRMVITAGAYLDPEVHKSVSIYLSVSFLTIYGLIETCTSCFITKMADLSTSHCGGPMSNTQFRLEDVQEFGLKHTDKDEEGRPYPRGQLLIRGPGVFLGYFKDDKRTSEMKDNAGWLHTGDLAAIKPENGALKIIGRRQNAFKLQKGEVIFPERVEQLLFKSYLFDEICLYGDKQHAYTVAIIVPKRAIIEQIATEFWLKASYEEICQNEVVRREFATWLENAGRTAGLLPYQTPKNIYLQPKSFGQKGILTHTLMVKRYVVKKLYAQTITSLYNEGSIISVGLSDLHVISILD